MVSFNMAEVTDLLRNWNLEHIIPVFEGKFTVFIIVTWAQTQKFKCAYSDNAYGQPYSQVHTWIYVCMW